LLVLESEIQERRRYYLQVIKSALDNLPSKELVEAITSAVGAATDNGKRLGPILVVDLIDSYEVDAQVFFEKETSNINALAEKVKATADAGQPNSVLSPMINQLIQVVKNWAIVAQPIQVSTKSLGIDHDASYHVAGLIRGLAIHLYNKHEKLDFSRQLINMLQEVFAEVVKVAERIAEDISSFDGIAEQCARGETTYTAYIGDRSKDMFCISSRGIEWKDRHWDFDSITGIRWGETHHLVNGYRIVFGSNSGYFSIELKRDEQDIYANLVDRLWRTIGVRLLIVYLKGVRDGKKYRFGTAVISDLGMEMEPKKVLSSNKRIFCRWRELDIWNGPDIFYVGKKGDKELISAFSYLNEDNIHVLEAAIRKLRERDGERLSSLLDEQ